MTAPADVSAATADGAQIDFGPAFGTWSAGWVAGTIVAAPLAIAATGATLGDELTIPQLAAASLATWSVLVAALVIASRRFGSNDLIVDYAARFRPIDLVGVPVGVATQLALVPALYAPLQRIWPTTFDDDEIAQRAQDLADRAGGWNTVLLAAVVVVGAPLVEEFVYRGLLQRSASTLIGPAFGLLGTSVLFALVHFSPVEYPGLFLAGLVFGIGVVLTGRIGPAIVTHAAFNATGLIVVLRNGG